MGCSRMWGRCAACGHWAEHAACVSFADRLEYNALRNAEFRHQTGRGDKRAATMLINQSASLPRSSDSTGSDALDWRAQMRLALRTPSALLEHLGLPPEPSSQPEFPMLVPLAFAGRMRPGDRADPLLRQVLPDPDECRRLSGFSADPVGDMASRQAPGVLHKYASRALLIATGACAVHCRYCFRQEFPYAKERAPGRRWQQALAYLGRHPDVHEIILSGGDPLMLPTRQLEELTAQLARLAHIKRLRVHTRMPLALPARITPSLLAWIERLPWPLLVVIHANHPAEFGPDVDLALAGLRAGGAQILNQAVLLAGVNDDADILCALMERGLEAGALPYYLHALDRVSGSQRFEVALSRARSLMEQLRRRLPGYLVPRLVVEQQGMPYKTPIL